MLDKKPIRETLHRHRWLCGILAMIVCVFFWANLYTFKIGDDWERTFGTAIRGWPKAYFTQEQAVPNNLKLRPIRILRSFLDAPEKYWEPTAPAKYNVYAVAINLLILVSTIGIATIGSRLRRFRLYEVFAFMAFVAVLIAVLDVHSVRRLFETLTF